MEDVQMFEQTLLENGGGSRGKKFVSVLLSTLLQCLLLGAMFLSPLLVTEGLPRLTRVISVPMRLGEPDAPPQVQRQAGSGVRSQAQMAKQTQAFTAPTHIPPT